MALICLLAEGHLLIEDVPGVGKTSLAKSLAASIDCSWKRVQFTPDLLPADLVGVSIYERSTEQFRFSPGPLFANIVLADEINRASPKTQSALLEAMEERQITVDGDDPRRSSRRSWSSPRRTRSTRRARTGCRRASSTASCCASRSGTRAAAAEMAILDGRGAVESLPKLSPVVSAAEVLTMIDAVRSVFLADALKAYLVDIAEASRRHPAVELGLSPRATLQLAAAARSHAAARGRRYATPDDVKVMAVVVPQPPPAAAHRPRRPTRPGRRDRRDPRRRAGAGRPLTDGARDARPADPPGDPRDRRRPSARSSSDASSASSSCTSSPPRCSWPPPWRGSS